MIAFAVFAFLAPHPAEPITPSPTVIDTTAYIGEVVDPADTVWEGRDSGGDDTTFTLHEDGTVAVKYGENSYNDPNDTWQVVNGVLHINIYLDDAHGEARYVGTWNPETSSVDTVMTTTVDDQELTVTLIQQ